MVNIQIRKNKEQFLYTDNIVRIDAKVTTDIDDADIIFVSWSFAVVGDPKGVLTHSGDAIEKQFLVYNDTKKAMIELKSTTGEPCTIKIIGRVHQRVTKVMTGVILDSDGNPQTSEGETEHEEIHESDSVSMEFFVEEPYV
jgi:hypothetical protein